MTLQCSVSNLLSTETVMIQLVVQCMQINIIRSLHVLQYSKYAHSIYAHSYRQTEVYSKHIQSLLGCVH